jgi:hypothetical protein
MASQRPARDIFRRDYRAIVNYKDVKPTTPPADPPADLPADPLIDPLLTASLETLDDAITAEPIPTTVATNTEPMFDHSNIYDDSYNDTLVTPATSIQPSESISQVPPRVPRLQAKSLLWSWVYNHFTTTVLDKHYILKRTQKQTQDHQHKCKKCSYEVLNSRRDGTKNMIDNLRKHAIYQTPELVSAFLSQQRTIDEMF